MADIVEEVYDEIRRKNYVLVKSDKREKLIKIEWPPYRNNVKWVITYEDGTPVDASLDGLWMSTRDAIRAINKWENAAKPTPQAKYADKPKAPPVRRKKVSNGSSSSQQD